MNTLRKILKPVASLRLTVILLALSMVLVLAGTLAQRYDNIWSAQRRFFYSGITFIEGQDFLPRAHAGEPWVYTYLRGKYVPMIGGYTLGVLLLLNLFAAHLTRFKFTWKRSGIMLIHFGLIVLFISQGAYSKHTEGVMMVREGTASNYAEDVRSVELAVVTPDPKEHLDVVIAEDAIKKGAVFADDRLPFTIKVDELLVNSKILGPRQGDPGGHPQVTAGEGLTKHVRSWEPVNGTSSEGENQPSAYLTLSKDGKPLGTYLVSTASAPMSAGDDDVTMYRVEDQDVTVDGKTYQIALRHTRQYKPYWIYLDKFHHDYYSGTDTPSNYSSDVRVVDPNTHTDRPVTISMNHPLRYKLGKYDFDTLYQSTFAGDHVTGLQVVRDPGWWMPYFAITVSAVGLLVHFGMALVTFLRKNAKVAEATGRAGTVPVAKLAAAFQAPAGTKDGANPPGSKATRGAGGANPDSYVLRPQGGWTSPARWFPALIGLICVAIIGYMASPAEPQAASFDYESFGRLPVFFEGRSQPLDTLARNSLRLMSGRDTLKVDNGRISASQWLLELMAVREAALERPVFRVDYPDVVSLLGGSEGKQYFSFRDVTGTEERLKAINDQVNRIRQTPPDDRDAFQSHFADLFAKLTLFNKLRSQIAPPDLRPTPAGPAVQDEFYAAIQAFGQGQAVPVPDALPAEVVAPFLRLVSKSVRTDWGDESMQLAPPADPKAEWGRLSGLIADSLTAAAEGQPPLDTAQARSARHLLQIIGDYVQNKPDAFNRDLSAYHRELDKNLPDDMRAVRAEVFYNRVAPFITGAWLYVFAFVLVAFSWLFWNKPFYRAAVAVVIVTLLLETAAIVARIYISGKPAVTNLYTVAVVIAWGGVVLCLGLAYVYRKSQPAMSNIAITAASLIGTLSLGLAYFIYANRLGGLSSETGDTMPKLQAVLNTNFWLATHVQCITLGYAATYLAGVLGIIFVVMRAVTPALDNQTAKVMSRMIYGIVCFAMLFSFVGTLLGGIWADQSWGRFWGWDAKENGAALLVAWNAIILHARWGGMVRERGLALLAIFGIVVTSWSGLGVNMLDIGLHKYAQMAEYAPQLMLFCLLMMLFIIVGLLPPFFRKADRPA